MMPVHHTKYFAFAIVVMVLLLLGIGLFSSEKVLRLRSQLVGEEAAPSIIPNRPLLQKNNLTSLGSFRLKTGRDYFSYSARGMSFSRTPAGKKTLYLAGMDWYQRVGQIEIPATLSTSAQWSAYTEAPMLQMPTDITDGILGPHPNPNKIGGTLPYNGRLIVSGYIYYDGNGDQRVSHGVSDFDLSKTNDFRGFFSMTNSAHARTKGGYMTIIPEEWRTLFGGPALTGNCCLAIIGASSTGPAVHVFDPDDVGVKDPVPATPLLLNPYPIANCGNQSAEWNCTTQITGIAFPERTNSVLFFGTQGVGPNCYKCDWDGDGNAAGGYDAPPYHAQVWAFDAAELLKVKKGEKTPQEVKPYVIWHLDDIIGASGILASAYDPVEQRLYLETRGAEEPTVTVLQIDTNVVAPVTAAPEITSFTNTAVDRRVTREGIQVYPGDSVTYTGTASDPDTALENLSWKWFYTIPNQVNVLFSRGQGAVQDVLFTYPAESAGVTYNWKLEVTDGEKTVSNTVAIEVIEPPVAETLPPPSKRSAGTLVRIGGGAGSRGAYFHTKENLSNGKVAVHGHSAPADLHIMECAPSSPLTAAEIFEGIGTGNGNAWGYQYKDKDAAYETNCVKNALNATPPRSIDECFLGPDAGKFIGRADGFAFVNPDGTLEVPPGEPYTLFVTSMNVISSDGERFSRCTKPAAPACGDGFREGTEPCDDGNSSNRDTCLATCTLNAPGDGFPVRSAPAAAPGEPCDDGNTLSTDGCSGTGSTETLYVCTWDEAAQKDVCTIPLGGAPGG